MERLLNRCQSRRIWISVISNFRESTVKPAEDENQYD